MGLLKKFWAWLTTKVSRGPRKGHPDLYPIDVDRIAKELNLVSEAARLGQGGIPAANAAVLSGPEAAIVQRVEKARQDYVDWAVLRLNVLSQGLSRTNITQDANRARQADKEFERKANAQLSEKETLLRQLGETARKRGAELDAFRRKNRLVRDAHYPTTSGLVLRYLVLTLLITVEAFLNAKFFAHGLDSGLLGGFITAASLAALNVCAAFVFGKSLIKYVIHVNPGLKVFGAITLIAAFVCMLFIGLGIAHYRDALIAEASEAAKVALDSLLAHPFVLRDIFSWMLLGISVLFGVFALVDGFTIDDAYPGYGDITRRTNEAVEDYVDELDTMRSELEALKDEELESLDRVAKQVQVSIARFSDLINDKKMAGSRLETAVKDADHSLNALLSKFRSENQLHRNGVPSPKYFNRPPELKPLQRVDFETAADEADLEAQNELVERLLNEMEEIRARIQAAFNQQFDRLKPLDIHFPAKDGINE